MGAAQGYTGALAQLLLMLLLHTTECTAVVHARRVKEVGPCGSPASVGGTGQDINY